MQVTLSSLDFSNITPGNEVQFTPEQMRAQIEAIIERLRVQSSQPVTSTSVSNTTKETL